MAERKKLHKFPRLEEIRNGEKLTRMLKKHLDAEMDEGLSIARAALTHVDAKRGKTCKMMIKAKIANGENIVGEQQYFGGVIAQIKHDPIVYYHKLNNQLKNVVAPRFGPASAFIPDWGLMLWAYPNDPNLPGLGALEDHASLLREMHARPAMFGLPEKDYKPITLKSRLTKYVPGMRCGAIFTVEGNLGGKTHSHEFFGKAYNGSGGKNSYEIMRKIRGCKQARNNGLRVVEPYGFDEKSGVVWQAAVEGKPLIKSVSKLKILDSFAGRIGESLAAFHALDLNLPKSLESNELVEELKQTCDAVQKTFPAYENQVRALQEQMLDGTREEQEKTPIHLSFKLSHVLEHDGELTFIDFDGARMGDPAYDLGRFNAQILRLRAESKLPSDIAEKTIRGFREGYNQKARKPIDEKRINWSTANHLVASQAFKTVKRKKEKALAGLLALANEALAGNYGA